MSDGKSAAPASRVIVWLSALGPLGLLGALVYLFAAQSGGFRLQAPPAPVENIAFERVVLKPEEIIAHVRNVGPEEVTIAQVQVGWTNRASWEFRAEPSTTIPRLGTARVRIPYPWTEGEPYEIALFTANGLVFTHQIAVATATPLFDLANLWTFAMLGVYVGVIPVFLGILWLPFLRSLGTKAYDFLLSLTVGLLVFLGVDALADAIEEGAELPGPFQGVGLIVIGLTLSLLGLYTFARSVQRRRQERGDAPLLLAYLIAFGIGAHNLGEGLAIGGAYALGEIATGALLIIGFMIHNLTEGVAVVAPIVRAKLGQGGTRITHLVGLGALAGVPTILGSALGGFAPSPVFAVLFLAIGAGAVFQVVVEIGRQVVRARGEAATGSFVTGVHFAGFCAGLAVMYVTGLFLAV
jgi:zinc transporter ZupT